MSHTPRTDAMIQPIPGKDCVTGSPIEVVHADDCRKLERELTALKRKYSAEPQADTPQNLEAQRAVGTTPSGDTPEGRQLAADARPAAAALNPPTGDTRRE